MDASRAEHLRGLIEDALKADAAYAAARAARGAAEQEEKRIRDKRESTSIALETALGGGVVVYGTNIVSVTNDGFGRCLRVIPTVTIPTVSAPPAPTPSPPPPVVEQKPAAKPAPVPTKAGTVPPLGKK